MPRHPTVIFADDPPGEVGGGSDVILAVPTAWCLSATIPTTGLPRAGRRAAMLYRLEALLPLAAEDVAADFVVDDTVATALGVCVPVATVKPVVDRIESAGGVVQSVVPASVRAASVLLADKTRPVFDAVAWGVGDSVEIFTVRRKQLTGWFVVPADAGDVVEQIAAIAAGPVRLLCLNLTPGLAGAVAKIPNANLVASDDLDMKTAARGGGITPMIELRRDGLAPADPYRAVRRPLVGLGVAAAVLVVCAAAVVYRRGDQYRQLADGLDRQQAAVFRSVLPGRTVPGNPLARLRTEERSLAAGGGSDSSPLRPVGPALNELLTALSAVPAEVRYQLADVRVADGRVSVDGTVKTRADADAVVAALRDRPGLKVDPPQTDQIAGKGFHFTVTAISDASHEPTATGEKQ